MENIQLQQFLSSSQYLISKDEFTQQDVQVLEQLIQTLYGGQTQYVSTLNSQFQQISRASSILNQIQQNSSSCNLVPTIMSYSKQSDTKFFALQILDEMVKTRWKVLELAGQEQIRKYVVEISLKLASDENTKQLNHLVKKANAVLVSVFLNSQILKILYSQIVKQTWNTTWTTFLDQILGAANESTQICENVFNILQILSQQIFDFSKLTIPSQTLTSLKQNMNKSFKLVFDLCMQKLQQYVEMSNSTPGSDPQAAAGLSVSLIRSCLKSLKTFMSWIPLGYIFETPLISAILQYYLKPVQFRQITLDCLLEVSNLNLDYGDEIQAKYIKQTIGMYMGSMLKIYKQILNEESLTDIYFRLEAQSQQNSIQAQTLQQFGGFCQSLVLYITGFFNRHLEHCQKLVRIIDFSPRSNPSQQCNPNVNLPFSKGGSNNFSLGQDDRQLLISTIGAGFNYIIQVMKLPQDTTFKICIDFFNNFSIQIYKSRFSNISTPMGSLKMAEINPAAPTLTSPALEGFYQTIYLQNLRQARNQVIKRMAKPPQVLIRFNKDGVTQKQQYRNTQEVQLYESMHDILVYITNFNPDEMSQFMTDVLTSIILQQEINYESLAKTCFAIGAISGTMNEQNEEAFIIKVIKQLLGLVEKCNQKDTKATVAADIMWVVGQYPRFLRNHYSFLKTVMKKLQEFIRESYPGVKDMAVDTLLRVIFKTKDLFVYSHDNEPFPYINSMIQNASSSYKILEENQQLIYFEAMSLPLLVVNSEQEKQNLLNSLLAQETQTFQNIIQEGKQNQNAFADIEVIQKLNQYFKIVSHVIIGAGPSSKIYAIGIFTCYIQMTCFSVNNDIEKAAALRRSKIVRRNIIKMIIVLVQKAITTQQLAQSIYPGIEQILNLFIQAPFQARDPQILELITAIVEKLGENFVNIAEGLGINMFHPVLQMLEELWEENAQTPEMRDKISRLSEFKTHYFNLLKVLIKKCGANIFSLNNNFLQILVKSLNVAIRDFSIDIQDYGLIAMKTLLQVRDLIFFIQAIYQFLGEIPQDSKTNFLQQHYINILMNVFSVLIDSAHKTGFLQQIGIGHLAQINLSNGDQSSKQYVVNWLKSFTLSQFHTINPVQMETYVLKMLNACTQWSEFRLVLRDFVIILLQFQADTPSLYAQEKEEQMNISKKKQQERRSSVPGLVGIFQGLTLSNTRALNNEGNLFGDEQREQDQQIQEEDKW